jgi:hypothetical protein
MIQHNHPKSSVFSNLQQHGGNFEDEFKRNITTCNSLVIASGYFGVSVLEKYKSSLLGIAARGSCKILVGMVFHEGVSASQKSALERLHSDLTQVNADSGVYITLRNYHGKIYKFTDGVDESIYVGSSNFSDSGFRTNYEFNTLVQEVHTRQQINAFIKFIFSERCDFVQPLDMVELAVKGTKTKFEKQEYENLQSMEITASDYPTSAPQDMITIQLRPDEQPNSSLNLCFEAGRKSKGKYTPRPWHEVEITSTKSERAQPGFPRGEFLAYVKDGNRFYRIPMITASADFKALTSKGNRSILGVLIKDKLERVGALKRGERITSETLIDYGSDTVTLGKISETDYLFEF